MTINIFIHSIHVLWHFEAWPQFAISYVHIIDTHTHTHTHTHTLTQTSHSHGQHQQQQQQLPSHHSQPHYPHHPAATGQPPPPPSPSTQHHPQPTPPPPSSGHVQHIYPKAGAPEAVPATSGIGGDLAAIIAAKAASRKPIMTSPTRKEFSGSGEGNLTRSLTLGSETSPHDARYVSIPI